MFGTDIFRKSLLFISFFTSLFAVATPTKAANSERHVFNSDDRPLAIVLDSKAAHHGEFSWNMCKASEVKGEVEKLSLPEYDDSSWMPAVVPGTVLTSLVYNKVYPDPYYGDNNKLSNEKIPDISKVGREFYTYWFRTEFDLPDSYKGKTVWLQPDGINYRAEVWINSNLVSTMAGMFKRDIIDITDFVRVGQKNAIAILVHPIDIPGTSRSKTWGAKGEFHNGGDGNIGWNVTQLMTIGWDFTYHDGIRDRNTGIWKGIYIYATGKAALRNVFVKSTFTNGDYRIAHEDASVEVVNPGNNTLKCTVYGEIENTGIKFSKEVSLLRGETREVSFSHSEYPQLNITNPKLWWPVNKGSHPLYKIHFKVVENGNISDSLTERFGIREITTSRNTPDKSKMFIVNGKPLFIRGSNWLPEAMLRTSDQRMEAEMRYTAQSGINLLRLWGGGIAESDRFYELCDELGILVWQEFWLSGDTRHPHDTDLYLANMESTVKRIRNHPSVAFYVSSNESSEVSGAHELLTRLDGTRPYQMQSECDGVHDGSPYKQVNPMRHYENTASDRGSRIDGFNPEYGAPTLPVYESLKEMMPASDLWPINKKVWDYLDGNGFHGMTSVYKDLVDLYGKSDNLRQFDQKAQLVGAMNSKSIWECWNENKFNFGDRFCSGLLFWYHNCTVPQVCARMWDHSLEPTASLYHTMHALEPIHVQFDYLKNTVSVVNDYPYALKEYKLTVRIYNLDSKQVAKQTASVSVPSDGVSNDVMKITFPDNVSQVHFISLELTDNNGKLVSENFYWRSKDVYRGKSSLTGPCTSGFESLSNMPQADKVRVKYKSHYDKGHYVLDVTFSNDDSRIAFFNQLEVLDDNNSPVRSTYYSDNFFTLLPGRQKKVSIDVGVDVAASKLHLNVSGWNVPQRKIILK